MNQVSKFLFGLFFLLQIPLFGDSLLKKISIENDSGVLVEIESIENDACQVVGEDSSLIDLLLPFVGQVYSEKELQEIKAALSHYFDLNEQEIECSTQSDDGINLSCFLREPPLAPREEIAHIKQLIIHNDSLHSSFDLNQNYGTESIQVWGWDEPGLSSILACFLGAEVEQQTLDQIQYVLFSYFRKKGRPFVVVRFPDQDASLGTIEISIAESTLGEVIVEGNSWTKTATLCSYLKQRPGCPIYQNRLSQDLFVMNQNPMRRVTAIYQSGKDPYTTDLILSVKEQKPERLYIGSDNTGVVTTGRTRLFGGFNFTGVFGMDQTLSFQYSASTDFHRFQAYTVDYKAPCSWGHIIQVFGGYSHVEADVSTFDSTKSHGSSEQASFRYQVPTRFTELSDCILGYGFDFKRTNNTVLFSENIEIFGKNVNLTQAIFSFDHIYDTSALFSHFLLSLYGSPGEWISDQSDADYASLRPGATNRWLYGHALLDTEYRFHNGASFSMLFRGQLSTTPLIASEQIGLGGYDTVRGYDEREYSADNGVIINLSLYSPSCSPLKTYWTKKIHDSFKALVFFDYGYGEEIHSIEGVKKHDFLMGAGPGLRYTLFPYLNCRLDWGIRLHRDMQLDTGWSRIHFSAILSY